MCVYLTSVLCVELETSLQLNDNTSDRRVLRTTSLEGTIKANVWSAPQTTVLEEIYIRLALEWTEEFNHFSIKYESLTAHLKNVHFNRKHLFYFEISEYYCNFPASGHWKKSVSWKKNTTEALR